MKLGSDSTDDKLIRVRRGKVDSVDLYEVKEHELEALENGAPVSLNLNFAIFFFSLAISCITTLSTATFENELIRNSFLFTAIISSFLTLIFGVLWRRDRNSLKKIVDTIRSRIPQDIIGDGGSGGILPPAPQDNDDLSPVG